MPVQALYSYSTLFCHYLWLLSTGIKYASPGFTFIFFEVNGAQVGGRPGWEPQVYKGVLTTQYGGEGADLCFVFSLKRSE